ncbi:glycosyltransferase family 2 protein [Burkholderia ubonensis]|uniref:glycosyltransferase family 2 protein n=1 Tax=Burkholderia ubonensis TaxID=101571 RepID=UPI0009B42DD4|nr:glycosyltransferase family 2 protein [Burkholderia ubonensis]
MKTTITRTWTRNGLSISIVVFRPDRARLLTTLHTLGEACERLRAVRPDDQIELYLVDNDGLGDVLPEIVESLVKRGIVCRTLSGHGNVGYGRGHNLAIERTESRLHLVLNPDIELDPQALVAAHEFFESYPDAGLLAPWVGDAEGHQQYLCRRYPSVLTLFVRGFVPAVMRSRFEAYVAYYEMRDRINARELVWDPDIVSGCFMLFRTDVLKRLGGFDPRYFLYFEDYDLSLRTHEVSRVAYVPSVRVVHHGGGASRKGGAHVRMFIASAFRFFNRFGWRWW